MFEAKLMLRNTPGAALELANLSVTDVTPQELHERSPLFLNLVQKENEISGGIEYFTDLFHENTIAVLKAQLDFVLAAFADNPCGEFSGIS